MGLHTVTRAGNLVRVVLKDGTEFVDRFVARPRNKRWLEFERRGRIARGEVVRFRPTTKAREAERAAQAPLSPADGPLAKLIGLVAELLAYRWVRMSPEERAAEVRRSQTK